MSGAQNSGNQTKTVVVDPVAEAARLALVVEELLGKFAVVTQQVEGLQAAVEGLQLRLGELESTQPTQPLPTAKPVSADLINLEDYPAGLYALKPGASFSGVIDHPFKDYTFREGRPQECDPATDTWLQLQIASNLIVRWELASKTEEAKS